MHFFLKCIQVETQCNSICPVKNTSILPFARLGYLVKMLAHHDSCIYAQNFNRNSLFSLCSPEFGVKPHDYPVRPLHQQAPSPLQTHTETVRVRIRDPQQESVGVGRNRNDPKEQYKRRSCSVLDAKELKMLGELSVKVVG